MQERVKILLVDDQPAKLLSYETVLQELQEDLLQAGSAREALDLLLKNEVAVILIDVCMPDLDGFQLAEMIREHPRFKKTGIIFVSAVQMTDLDRLRGYQLGAVDYVPVPVIPELLRAKVRVFTELFRKSQELENANDELERRVAERTEELAAANARMALAIEVAQLGTWELNIATGEFRASEKLFRMLGHVPDPAEPATLELMLNVIHPDDRPEVQAELFRTHETGEPYHYVFRAIRPDGAIIWCEGRASYDVNAKGRPTSMVGVIRDITEQKRAAEHQEIMMQELHHRVKNSLTTVQAIANLSRRTATNIETFSNAFNSRIVSLSKTHTMLVDNKWNRIHLRDILASELRAFEDLGEERFELCGSSIDLPSQMAVSLGLAFHELTTNAVKHGSLSVPDGRLVVKWALGDERDEEGNYTLHLHWREHGGPIVKEPTRLGFGTALLRGLFNEHNSSHITMQFERTGIDFQLAIPWTPH
nr:D427 [uncultured bacterium]